jgi:hypothetical protein
MIDFILKEVHRGIKPLLQYQISAKKKFINNDKSQVGVISYENVTYDNGPLYMKICLIFIFILLSKIINIQMYIVNKLKKERGGNLIYHVH